MNINQVDEVKTAVADYTFTYPDSWEYINGPQANMGIEHWLRHEESGQEVYYCDDQGSITMEVVNPDD